jgi:hypothetical protein
MRCVKSFAIFVIAFTLITACALCPPIDPKQKLIMHFDDHMIRLAKAVDVVVDTLPPNAKDQEIFSAAVQRSGDPNLLKPFDGYVLKARIEDGAGIILLCAQDSKEGIIEDVTCTTRPDCHRPSGSPCVYLLDPKLVCSAP